MNLQGFRVFCKTPFFGLHGTLHDLPSRKGDVEWKKLADSVDVAQTFYALRHTAYTIAGTSKDRDARSYFAGHAWSGLAEIYNEDFDDQRLVVIGELIDKWLGEPTEGPPTMA